jgi:putative transposase
VRATSALGDFVPGWPPPTNTWIVERTFAWLARNRRLSKDYEYAVPTSEAMIDVAAIRLLLNRLTAA